MPKQDALQLPELPLGRAANGHATAQEHAYARLRHSILIGAITPGRAITIRGLAEALSLSPTPVREALRRLSSEGALSVLGNRRIVVPEMNPRRFEEMILLRSTLETHAAQRALPFVSDVLVDELERMDHRMDAAVEKGDQESLVILNQDFHARLYSINPEQIVMPMIESVWLQLGPFQRVAARHVGEHYIVDRHKEIIAALRMRDARALAAAIDADVRDGVGRLGREALRRILGDDAIRSSAPPTFNGPDLG